MPFWAVIGSVCSSMLITKRYVTRMSWHEHPCYFRSVTHCVQAWMDGAVAREVPAPRPFSPQRLTVVTTSYPCPIPPNLHHACVLGPFAYHAALTVASQILHPTHMKPEGAGVFATRDAGQGFVLHLRPVTDSAAGVTVLRRRTPCFALSLRITRTVLCRLDHAATDGGGNQHALHDAADEPQSAVRADQCCTAAAAVTAVRYCLGRRQSMCACSKG